MEDSKKGEISGPHSNPLCNVRTTSNDIPGVLGPVTLSGTLIPPSPLLHPSGVDEGEALMETSPPDVPSPAATPATEEGIRVVTEDGPSDPDVVRPQSPSQENKHFRATNKNNKKRKRGKQPSPSRGGRSYRQTHWNPLPKSEPPPGVANDGSYPIYFILPRILYVTPHRARYMPRNTTTNRKTKFSEASKNDSRFPGYTDFHLTATHRICRTLVCL
jgi:hypothetical protein